MSRIPRRFALDTVLCFLLKGVFVFSGVPGKKRDKDLGSLLAILSFVDYMGQNLDRNEHFHKRLESIRLSVLEQMNLRFYLRDDLDKFLHFDVLMDELENAGGNEEARALVYHTWLKKRRQHFGEYVNLLPA